MILCILFAAYIWVVKVEHLLNCVRSVSDYTRFCHVRGFGTMILNVY